MFSWLNKLNIQTDLKGQLHFILFHSVYLGRTLPPFWLQTVFWDLSWFWLCFCDFLFYFEVFLCCVMRCFSLPPVAWCPHLPVSSPFPAHHPCSLLLVFFSLFPSPVLLHLTPTLPRPLVSCACKQSLCSLLSLPVHSCVTHPCASPEPVPSSVFPPVTSSVSTWDVFGFVFSCFVASCFYPVWALLLVVHCFSFCVATLFAILGFWILNFWLSAFCFINHDLSSLSCLIVLSFYLFFTTFNFNTISLFLLKYNLVMHFTTLDSTGKWSNLSERTEERKRHSVAPHTKKKARNRRNK